MSTIETRNQKTPKIRKQKTLTHYKFDKKKRWFSRRRRKKALADFAIFVKRLGIEEGKLSKDNKHKINDFLLTHNYNIYWYGEALLKERILKGGTFILSVAVLVAIPYGIYYLSKGAEVAEWENVTLSLSIILSGFFAVFKGLTKWVQARKFEGQFWKASADLKTSVYSLEGEFNETVKQDDGTLTSEFETALDDAIKEARRIVAEETEAYFKNYSAPSVDVASAFPGGAGELMKKYTSPRLSKQMRLSELKAELDVLKGLEETAQGRLKTASAIEQAAIVAELQQLRMQLILLKTEKAKLEAGLA